MKTRHIVGLAFAQLGLVVFGYLLTCAAVKLGFPGLEGFDRAPWLLRTVRHYGYVLIAVPMLWTAAVCVGRRADEDAAGGLYCIGILLTATLALLFVYCVGAGFLEPPRPTF